MLEIVQIVQLQPVQPQPQLYQVHLLFKSQKQFSLKISAYDSHTRPAPLQPCILHVLLMQCHAINI